MHNPTIHHQCRSMASNSRIDIPNQTNVTWLIDALLKSGAYNTISVTVAQLEGRCFIAF